MEPLLLEPLENDSWAERLAISDGMAVEPKYDGERLLVQIGSGFFRARARSGNYRQVTDLPHGIGAALKRLSDQWQWPPYVLDGEDIKVGYIIYDLLTERCGRNDCPCAGIPQSETRPHRPFVERRKRLLDLAPLPEPLAISFCATGAQEKAALIQSLRDTRAEGYVIKRLTDGYRPGRHKGGPFKVKFVKSLSALVAAHDAEKDAVTLALLNEQQEPVIVGRMKACPKPPVGSIVEVRYQYFTPGGRLYQPVFDKLRTDIDPFACTLDQVVLKGDERRTHA